MVLNFKIRDQCCVFVTEHNIPRCVFRPGVEWVKFPFHTNSVLQDPSRLKYNWKYSIFACVLTFKIK